MSFDLIRRCHVLALVLRTVSHGLLRGDMDDGTNGGGGCGLLVAVLLPLLLHGARDEVGMETEGVKSRAAHARNEDITDDGLIACNTRTTDRF